MNVHSRSARVGSMIALIAAVSGCASPPGPAQDAAPVDARADLEVTQDVAPNDSPSTACHTDPECSDGVFCNGVERCSPGTAGADARGCVSASPAQPCSAGQTCNEAMARCVSGCPDADGDGHTAVSCGGDDCDDADANRFPGRMEVCDVARRDEDCDPTTFGFRDGDGDSYADSACCNVDSTGAMRCGDDCNDSRPNVHPSLVEACDGLDNDCNSMVDEGVLRTFYRDADGDGFAVAATSDAGAGSMQGCVAPAGYTEMRGDCLDSDGSVHPGAVEVCDPAMVDENCDGVTNPPSLCDCVAGASRTCDAAGLVGACSSGTQQCLSGHWSVCSIAPRAEVCNMLDDNCDGMTDEGVQTTCYVDADGDGYAPAGAATIRTCGACPTSYTSRIPTGSDIDCNDSAVGGARSNPGGTESCDHVDNDCDGSIDEGVTVTLYVDRDGDTFSTSGTTTGCPGDPGTRLSLSSVLDCNDDPGNHGADAFPGQTQYFAVPYSYCGGGGGGICSPRSSWDYDCNGIQDKPPSSVTACTGARCGVLGGCSGGGWQYVSTVPCGGSPANLTTCGCGGGTTCVAMTSAQPLGCR